MSITFDRSLVTGNEMIDTQHRELIGRVNRLAEECVPGTEKRTAVGTLDFLLDYTDYHLPRRKHFRRRADTRSFQHTIWNMRNLRKPWKICGLCWRRKRGPAKRLWMR